MPTHTDDVVALAGWFDDTHRIRDAFDQYARTAAEQAHPDAHGCRFKPEKSANPDEAAVHPGDALPRTEQEIDMTTQYANRQSSPDEHDLLTIVEAADLLRTPVATLRYWRNIGYGPGSFRVGRGVRYWRHEILEWLHQQSDDGPERRLMASRPVGHHACWCHNGTIKRMNLRDVPDEVYAALSEAASTNRQSLSAYVVDRLAEAAQVARIGDYLSEYRPAEGSKLTLEDAVAAVREVRETS